MPQKVHENQAMSPAAALCAAGLCILFGGNAVAIKVCLTGLGPFTAAGIRFTLASAAIWTWARLRGLQVAPERGRRGPLLLVSLFFTLQLGLFYLGLSKTHATRGAIIINLFPFLVLLIAHFAIPGERINARKTVGMLLGFAGVLIMLPGEGGMGGNVRGGDLVVLAGTVVWAASTVYIKRILVSYEPFQVVLLPMVLSVPLFFGAGFLWDAPMVRGIDTAVLLSLFYQGFVTASFGFVAWNTLLRRHGATTLNAFVFLMPVAGVIAAGVVLGEALSPRIIAALLFIVLGLGVVFRR